MKILNSKLYQAYLILSVVLGWLGIIYWLRGNFLSLEYVKVFSICTAIILGLITIAPLASAIWGVKSIPGVKIGPRWVLRYLSIPALYLAFSVPMYFFFSNTVPCIYTELYGFPQQESLIVSRKYTTGKRVDKYWIRFKEYENSLRVTFRDYNDVSVGSYVISEVLKSNLGVYIENLNANKALQRTSR